MAERITPSSAEHPKEKISHGVCVAGPMTVHTVDGVIRRVRPIVLTDDDTPGWVIKARGKEYTPQRKFTMSLLGYCEKDRTYAYDRLKQTDKAEASWRQAMELTRDAEKGDDDAIYVKSASHLANLLCVNGDYEGTIQLAAPIITRLEEQKRDTTSDYENLLIYVTCCKAAVGGGTDEEIEAGFEEAYARHQEYIKKNRNDTSYKNAIAGLINIAYYCVKFKKYKYALTYTRNFGELLGEYEQREGVSADYIDRQLGRYDIYKAMALQGLGEKVLPLVSSIIELVGKMLFTWLIIPILGLWGIIICEPLIWAAMTVQLLLAYWKTMREVQ
mgnify:CR=1 FL=1